MCVYAQSLSCIRLFETPWTVACQTPLYIGFCRQEYSSGLPGPPAGDLSDPGIEPMSTALQVDSLPLSLRLESPELDESFPSCNTLHCRYRHHGPSLSALRDCASGSCFCNVTLIASFVVNNRTVFVSDPRVS